MIRLPDENGHIDQLFHRCAMPHTGVSNFQPGYVAKTEVSAPTLGESAGGFIGVKNFAFNVSIDSRHSTRRRICATLSSH